MKRLLTTAVASVVAALSPIAAYAQPKPVNVLVTIGMIGDVVENVGGDCVEVTAMMGPGVDPHLYEPSSRDVRSLRSADVIFFSGYSLEGQLGDVLARFGEQKPTIAVAPSSIDTGDLITVQDVYGIDPHLWMDASLWSRIAPTIAGTLADAQPECADDFKTNAQNYVEQLTALHDWVKKAIASIPEGQRSLVTAHDAFAYFGRAYGIEVLGIQGISTESEASVADIRATAKQVAAKGVPAIFVESTINPRTIQSVIDAAREQGHQVEIGGELYSDAMGETGTAGGTYIGMIFENTRNITTALGGQLPEIPDVLSGWAEQWNIAGTGEN
ncbi:metal ABC transporter solute-binding protein, Zn/Mn family [Nitratireductor basaltis]|uniref:Periplasmic solute binding protein n=1 Tax=Nitratireductor basaltis TaxID=472175 RepID=A0A084U8J3_9HYPH|nr:zinc ABC transporter substrate-binding protein [Nitratireductor basaltis]KFB09279.1 Periplasmic solute binding protein precursor [Nitratireductor basaltis]